MIKKELIPDVQCKRCMQMHRADDPMCPHCGYPMPDSRAPAKDASSAKEEKSREPDRQSS